MTRQNVPEEVVLLPSLMTAQGAQQVESNMRVGEVNAEAGHVGREDGAEGTTEPVLPGSAVAPQNVRLQPKEILGAGRTA